MFLKGIQIYDGISIANGYVEDQTAKDKKGVVLILDLEKAYDRVDWDCLDFPLTIKEYGSKWRK